MLTIQGVRVDDPDRVYVIAEASGNHNQNYTQAEALVRAAAEAGANAVKFQTFTAERIAADIPIPTGHHPAHDAWLMRMHVHTLQELFAKGGLPRAWHAPLKTLAESLGLAFLSTPFSVEDAKFLVQDVGVPALKIASGDLTFYPLLAYAAGSGLPVLLSTGGATYREVAETRDYMDEVTSYSIRGLVLLHCVSAYPCTVTWTNLRAITTLREHLCDVVGWSDHTLSADLIPALAVACGATVIEKHLRLADDTTSIDVAHSLDPNQFAQMVRTVRLVPLMLGHGRKEPQPEEQHDRLWARRDPRDWLRPTAAAREGAWQ